MANTETVTEITGHPEVTAPHPLGGRRQIAGRTPMQLAWARLRRDKVSIAASVVIVLLVAMAVGAPLWTHLIGHDPDQQYHTIGLTPDGLPIGPNHHFWLGTDNLGRDIFSRIIWGSRISLLVGVVATGIAVVIGLIIGLFAGYFGGRVDTVLSRFMDVVLSFPFLLFAISLVSLYRPSVTISIAVIAFFSWASVGRVVRGQVLSAREKEYVEAARSLGASDVRIMVVDILPNLIAPVIIYGTLLIPVSIVFEATLSFLGMGVIPPTPTWGNMLSDSTSYYQTSWWFVVYPSLALLITTLAFNLLGDGLRDALDPRAMETTAR